MQTTDPDLTPGGYEELDGFSYYLVDQAGKGISHALFEVDNATGSIKLKSAIDDAQVGTYTLLIKVVDLDNHHLNYREQVTINVVKPSPDVNEPAPNTVTGLSRNETLRGTNADDIISGLGGNDKLYGLAGNDTLSGGAGKDKLYGGASQDNFLFDAPVKKGHFDQVMDFKPSDDTIQISLAALKSFKLKGAKASDITSKKASDDKGKSDDKGGSKKAVGFDKIFKKNDKLQKKFFDVGTKSTDKPDGSNDYIFYNKKSGIVYLDVDGSGAAKGIELLKVKPGTALTAADFLFI